MATTDDLSLIAEPETFQSLNPATGEVIDEFPVNDEDAVHAAVALGREAAPWWDELGFEGRRERLLAWKKTIARNLDSLAELMHRENGKPRFDAELEILFAIDHIDWAAKNAGKVLGLSKVGGSLFAIDHTAMVEYPPLGVVGVIGPWNYPVYTPMGSIVYALAAGNAVVYKPSEYTPAVGRWLANSFSTVVPERQVFSVVHGSGETGAALCRAGIDKLAFTGSAATGRKVMAACAETLTPVLMELGGNDAMVVDDDADVEAAATAAVWGSLQNGGQACISVERAYVTSGVYDRFVELVTEKAQKVRAGHTDDAHIGPITMPSQIDVIEHHLNDAIAKGARAVVGGTSSVRRPYVDPVVLVDVPDDALLLHEETFGPVLPIVRVADADEAIAKANDTTYGLAATVFGKRRGLEIARRLRSGMTSVNSYMTFAAVPSLPFGGVGDSGFGRIHGADGLKEFTRAKAIARKRLPGPTLVQNFERPTWVGGSLRRLLQLRHTR